jgi:hypothetical protein
MMKYLKYILGFILAFTLASCLDTEEKIVINRDNSGIYSLTLDMGKMLEMAATMGANSSGDKPKEKKDTLVYLKGLLDSATNVTAEEKALFRDGSLTINLDEEKNALKVAISCPFKNMEGLSAVKANLFTLLKKVKALEKASGEQSKEEEATSPSKLGDNSTNPVADQFTFLAAPGSISNTITNMEAYKNKIATDSTLSTMHQMSAMMGDFKYRTIIVLPKNIKKYEGPGSLVSADKKTVTFETTLTEMMENPEKVSYKVEY